MAHKTKNIQHAKAGTDKRLREIVEYGDDCGFEETIIMTPEEWAETDRMNAEGEKEQRRKLEKQKASRLSTVPPSSSSVMRKSKTPTLASEEGD